MHVVPITSSLSLPHPSLQVRLTRHDPEVSIHIAEAGGIIPLVKLLGSGTAGARLQSASALAELALIPLARDSIAAADGIEPLIALLVSTHANTSETAARTLSHIALDEASVALPY